MTKATTSWWTDWRKRRREAKKLKAQLQKAKSKRKISKEKAKAKYGTALYDAKIAALAARQSNLGTDRSVGGWITGILRRWKKRRLNKQQHATQPRLPGME